MTSWVSLSEEHFERRMDAVWGAAVAHHMFEKKDAKNRFTNAVVRADATIDLLRLLWADHKARADRSEGESE